MEKLKIMSKNYKMYLSRMRLGNLYNLEYKDTIVLNGGIEEDV